jgi:hypothetical protein
LVYAAGRLKRRDSGLSWLEKRFVQVFEFDRNVAVLHYLGPSATELFGEGRVQAAEISFAGADAARRADASSCNWGNPSGATNGTHRNGTYAKFVLTRMVVDLGVRATATVRR